MPEKLSASRASKHLSCHASANLELAIPNWVPPEVDDTQDNAANRGTRMHEMFAGIMELNPKDMAMMAKAIEYVAEIRRGRRFKVFVEASMKAMWLDTEPSTTADLVLYLKDELHIFDLKTGTIPVSAFGNEQLLYYAATYAPLAPNATEVHLHIVQPWADVMEEWVVATGYVANFMVKARQAEQAIQGGDVTFVPGDHCQFCPANPHGRGAKGKPYCPAMMSVLYPTPPIDEEEILKGD